jgi:hypothetical protein
MLHNIPPPSYVLKIFTFRLGEVNAWRAINLGPHYLMTPDFLDTTSLSHKSITLNE